MGTNTDRQHTNVLELRSMMHSLWKLVSQYTDQWLADQGVDITRLQLGLLRMLEHEGAHTLSELSRKFGVDPSTLVPTVNALERKGYITRERDPDDRRRVPIGLTDAGQTLSQSIPAVTDDDPLLLALAQLGDADTEHLLRLMCRLVSLMPEGALLLTHMESRLSAQGAKKDFLICKHHDD
ncbi:MAG: MarR family winged helix-turn-helix transcriptional regulator [Chloroflexota bacterium]